jgi:hypothetical protein
LQDAKAKGSPIVVVGHHPLFLTSAEEDEQYYNIPPERRSEILRLFVQHGVVAMLTGHTHKFSENTYRDILLVSGETTSKNFDRRPLGFRIWEVDLPDTIRHTFVPLDVRVDAVE